MTFSIDHVVIAVSDLDRAISDYQGLGFTVLRGGEHPRRGSVNALVVFQDSTYFELIAFPRPALGFRWWEILQRSGPGFVDFALLASPMETDLERARARGFVLGPAEPGGRVAPEGQRSEWQTVRAPTSDVPFLVGDITSRSLRVPEGKARIHANGALGIAKIDVAVSHLATSVARYRALLPGSLETEGDLAARFICDPGILEVRQPAAGVPVADPLVSHLQQRGEGPFCVSLRAAGNSKVDHGLSHGAELALAVQPDFPKIL
jgi:catechol 2,3-dioxygenase-like lactoylglutathione lyase family enzyme